MLDIPPKKMILMQGIPGSGKSVLARRLHDIYTGDEWDGIILSTDNERVAECGHYIHDAAKNSEQHAATQRKCVVAMQAETNFIFIDNTNIEKKHVEPYINLAKMFGYEIEAIRVSCSLEEAKRRNRQRNFDRRVPDDVIESMHSRLESLL